MNLIILIIIGIIIYLIITCNNVEKLDNLSNYSNINESNKCCEIKKIVLTNNKFAYNYKVNEDCRRDYNSNFRNIFENDKLEINEKESIKSLVRSIYLSGSSYVKNGPDWYITVNFSKELIIEELLKQGIITSVKEVEKFYPTYSRSICENSARGLIENNKELFTSFIKSSLETIANNILEHSGDTQRIELDFNQIVQIPEKEEITI
jgi:hypothetical protein